MATRRAIRKAERALDEAQYRNDRAVRDALAAYEVVVSSKGRLLASYFGVSVYERFIETPHGQGSIAGVQASVDSQPSSRITATRLVTLGVFALAARKNTGALYLSIDTPEFASVVEVHQSNQLQARDFAARLVNQRRKMLDDEAARALRVEAARLAIEEVSDESEIQRLKIELDGLRAAH
jgi:hypothetical protein